MSVIRCAPLLLCGLFAFTACKQHNTFSFCRDFDVSGCLQPVADTVVYPLAKTVRDKTVLHFANSVYFRADRLAFALTNARSKYDVTFECLHGHYFFEDAPAEKHEMEYIELRENNVYGLVLAGSMIEKKYAALKNAPYRPLPAFSVTFAVYCGKDLLSKKNIRVELK